MINGIVHTALYTDRFDETVRFYEALFDGENLGEFTASAKGCWIKIGGSVLEIFESPKLPEAGVFKHIAVDCDDVDGLYEKALSLGAVSHVAPKNTVLEMKEPQKLRIAFVKGINGEQIELCSIRR